MVRRADHDGVDRRIGKELLVITENLHRDFGLALFLVEFLDASLALGRALCVELTDGDHAGLGDVEHAFHVFEAHPAAADLGDLDALARRSRAEERAGEEIRQGDEAGGPGEGGFEEMAAVLHRLGVGRHGLFLGKMSDLDGAVGNLVAVVLKQDVAFRQFAEGRPDFVFARSHLLAPFLRTALK